MPGRARCPGLSACPHFPRLAGGTIPFIRRFDYLSVMVEGMGDAKCSQAQAGRFAACRGLQHVLGGHLDAALCPCANESFKNFNIAVFIFRFSGPLPPIKSLGKLSEEQTRAFARG